MAKGKAKAKGASEAGKLIKSLRKKGYSDAAIGRALDRDSSLIGQVRRGVKPGSNLVDALKAFSKGEKITPPRRQTKAGKPAKVRRPSVRGSKGEVLFTAETKAGDKQRIRELKAFKKQKRKVTVKLTFTKWQPYRDAKRHKQTVSLYNHGRDAQAIIDAANEQGMSIDDYLIDQAKKVHQPWQAEGFKGLSFIQAGEED